MPSLETTHPNCDAAIPGPPWNAPFCALRGDPNRTAPFHALTQRTTMPMTKPTNPTSRRGFSRRQLLKATGGTAALLAAAKLNFPAGAFAQGAGPEVTKAHARVHRVERRRAAVRRQGQGAVRQIRHARRRSRQAGVMGHHPRQPRAGLGRQRHRRRAYPDADAVSDLGRQGDAEQSADADVHPGAAQSRQPVHLGCQGICRPQGRRRHRAVQGRRSRRRRPPASRSRPR